MRVLVACEYSGRVRDAFLARGHDAMSVDFLDSETPGPHYKGDMWEVVHDGWDLMVAHPPCTHLALSGNRWWAGSPERRAAARFVMAIAAAPVKRIAIENPVSALSTLWRKPDQYIHPWQFGHGETKKTGLWLLNLPKLVPTNIVDGREARVHRMSPGPDRWRDRSRTYPGIAQAMADQWGTA